jgi:hypothetical protein
MQKVYNGLQSPLEAAAIAARNVLLPTNTYNNVSPSNEYKATHTRALSDSTTPNNGKSSGGFLDIENYSGVGSDFDKNGNQFISVGSGRNQAFGLNSSTWGYGPTMLGMKSYTAPDSSLNAGQVNI